MRNKYPGVCYRCGKTVASGDGHFERYKGSYKWRTQHATCAIEHRAKVAEEVKQSTNNIGVVE